MSRILPTLGLMAIFCALQSPAAPLLDPSANGSLEAPYSAIESKNADFASGEVAHGWEQRTSTGQAIFSMETEGVKEGNAAQRITVKNTGGREVEFNKRLKLEKNKICRFTVWLKADTILKCRIFVRQTSAPYAIFVGKTIEVSPEWTAFSLQGELKDGDVRFVIGIAVKGTLWVDDFQVEEASATAASTGPVPGNYLDNSSFEAGLTGGWRVLVRGGGDLAASARAESLPVQYGADSSTFVTGQKSLKISLQAGQAALLTSPAMMVAEGRDYVGSIALKSDNDTEATLSFLGADGKELSQKKKLL